MISVNKKFDIRNIRNRRLLQYFFIAGSYLGSFSIQRILPGDYDYGVLLEPRFLVNVPLFLLLLAGFLAGERRPRLDSEISVWLALFFLVHLTVGLSYFWAVDPIFASSQLIDVAMLVLSVLVFICLFWDDIDNAPSMFLLCASWLAGPLLIATVATGAFTGGEISVFGAGGIGMSRVFGIAALSAAIWYLRSPGPVPVVSFLVLIVGIAMSGSRAALLAVGVACAIVFYFRQSYRFEGTTKKSFARIFVAIVTVVAMLLGFLFVVGPDVVFRYGLMLLMGNIDVEGASNGIYLAGREEIFPDAISLSVLHPLGGLGLGDYVGPYGEMYPHNLFLVYAVDAGIPVAIGVMILLVWGHRHCGRLDRNLGNLVIPVSAFFFTVTQFAGSYFDARFLWFTTLILLKSAIPIVNGASIGAAIGSGSVWLMPILTTRESK